MSDKFSHSKINTYNSCPLRYKFHYIDRISLPEIIGIETVMGDTVHETLERLYRSHVEPESKLSSIASQSFYFDETPKAKKFETKQDIVDEFKLVWEEYIQDCEKKNTRIKTKSSKSFERYYKLGEKCIVNYWNAHKPFTQDKTLGVELEIDVDLNNDGKYVMVGILDRLSRTGKATYNIIDYKTYAKLPGTKKISEMSKQLEIYEFAIRDMYPDAKRINLIWYMLLHDEEVRITKNLDDPIDQKYLNKSRERIMENIDKIKVAQTDSNFPPKVSRICSWCEYKNICPAWKTPNNR